MSGCVVKCVWLNGCGYKCCINSICLPPSFEQSQWIEYVHINY